MIVIADSTVLINLAKAEVFFVLHKLFNEVVISPAVYEEVVIAGQDRYGATEVKEASWIRIVSVNDADKVKLLLPELDRGEAESIALALEQKANLVLADDVKARNTLHSLGIKVRGTLGLLVESHRRGLVPDVRKALDQLITRGTWIDRRLYTEILKVI